MSIIKLNVGGIEYVTLKSTIEKSSYLLKIINNKDIALDDDNIVINGDDIFIDKDGSLFEIILKWMRGYKICIEELHRNLNGSDMLNLYIDCKYFGVGLKDVIKKYFTRGSRMKPIYLLSAANEKNKFIDLCIHLKREEIPNFELVIAHYISNPNKEELPKTFYNKYCKIFYYDGNNLNLIEEFKGEKRTNSEYFNMYCFDDKVNCKLYKLDNYNHKNSYLDSKCPLDTILDKYFKNTE